MTLIVCGRAHPNQNRVAEITNARSNPPARHSRQRATAGVALSINDAASHLRVSVEQGFEAGRNHTQLPRKLYTRRHQILNCQAAITVRC